MKKYGSKTQLQFYQCSGSCNTGHIRQVYRTRPEYAEQKHFLSVPGHTGHVRQVQDRNNELAACDSSFSSSIYCIPASQQINCSTREPLKASYGKIKYFSISHFQYFTNMHICESLSSKQIKWLSYKVQVLVTNGEDEVDDIFIKLSLGQQYRRL